MHEICMKLIRIKYEKTAALHCSLIVFNRMHKLSGPALKKKISPILLLVKKTFMTVFVIRV